MIWLTLWVILNNKSQLQRKNFKIVNRPWEIKNFVFMNSRNRLKSSKSSSLCLITKLKNSKETLDPEKWKSLNFKRWLLRCNKKFNISTELTRTCNSLSRILFFVKWALNVNWKRSCKKEVNKTDKLKNSKMMCMSLSITSLTLRKSKRALLSFTNSMFLVKVLKEKQERKMLAKTNFQEENIMSEMLTIWDSNFPRTRRSKKILTSVSREKMSIYLKQSTFS